MKEDIPFTGCLLSFWYVNERDSNPAKADAGKTSVRWTLVRRKRRSDSDDGGARER